MADDEARKHVPRVVLVDEKTASGRRTKPRAAKPRFLRASSSREGGAGISLERARVSCATVQTPPFRRETVPVDATPVLFGKLGISLLLGLLVGLQRQRTASDMPGLRTFR